MAVASLVLGILSIVFMIIPIVGFCSGIIGTILGSLAYKNAKNSNDPVGIALGGLVTSIIGAVVGGLIYITCFSCMGGTGCMCNPTCKPTTNLNINQPVNIQKNQNKTKKVNDEQLRKMDEQFRQFNKNKQKSKVTI